MNLQTLKKHFLEYVEIEKGRSLKTRENYERYLKKFLEKTGVKEPTDITDDVIREFRLWLNRQPGAKVRGLGSGSMKKRTQNYYLIALRAFLKYMVRRGIKSLQPERIELAKVGDRSLDLISREELERLLTSPKGSDAAVLRDKAILELLFSTGLRVSELCSLPRDINLRESSVSVRGKGDKVRVVFVSDEAKKAVKAYLDKRKDMHDALFVQYGRGANKGTSRLSSRSVERIVKHYAIKSGITKKVTPHVIRHSFATDLLSNGADLRSVQALLGHANITTTQVYTHVTDKHLEDVHRNFHGKSRKHR